MAKVSLDGLFPVWPNIMIFGSTDVLALAGLTEMTENSTLVNKNPNNTASVKFRIFLMHTFPQVRRGYQGYDIGRQN
jgi:hypothetical protein